MLRTALVVCLSLAALSSCATSNFHLGRRSLDAPVWKALDVEDQYVFGYTYDDAWDVGGDFGLGFEISTFASFASGEANLDAAESSGSLGADLGTEPAQDEDTIGATAEVSVGPHALWKLGDSGLRLIAGTGPSYIAAGLDDGNDSDIARSFAWYWHAGLVWGIGAFNLGVDYRALLSSDLEFQADDVTVESDADYDQLSLLIGFSI